MKIQPIFPVGIMLMIFAVLFGLTAFVIIKNKLNTLDKILTLLRLTFIYILVLVIGLRPVKTYTKYEFATKNLDVLFVVDSTISMWANDYDGGKTRMEGVKNDINLILKELSGSNFGLIAFDDTARVLSPFTQDMKYISDLVSVMTMPDSYYASGSDLSIAYRDISSLLESSDKKENRKTIVFYISDGEITNGKKLASFAELSKYIDNGAVLGYGSADGGKMKDKFGYVYDYNSHSDAISRIDENNLKKIAGDMGIEYLNMNSGNSSLTGLVELIKESSATIVEQGNGAEKYIDTYYYFAAVLCVMLLLEAVIFIRRGRL